MRRTVLVWLLFLLCIFVLSLAATPYWKTADVTIICLRLTVIAVASVLAVREWWRHRHGREDVSAPRRETLLRRLRRWYYGGEKE